MGYWGTAPWDNDDAADWFVSAMSQTKLPDLIERTLRADPVKHADQIRAAAALLVLLGRAYTYDERFEEHLNLAIEALDLIKPRYKDDPEFAYWIEREMKVLQRRLECSDKPLSTDLVKWWSRWI